MNNTNTPPVPPLAGLCSFDEARRAELPVEKCVGWMKRHHYVLHRLHGVFTARLTAEPLYELKTAFSHHAYLCAEHVTALRKRVSELREPPLGLEAVPHASLERCLEEVLAAPTTSALLLGVYEVLVPALIESLERYLATTNLLADAPSVRIARFCKLEMEDLERFGAAAIAAVVDAPSRIFPPPSGEGQGGGERLDAFPHPGPPPKGEGDASEDERASLAGWLTYLRGLLADAGGLHGRDEPPASADVTPRFSTAAYVYDGTPQRDARFQDSYNAGVNPEAFLYDERFSPRDKVLMMYYKRLRELDVPEMMASILHETAGKPWKFHADMSRQLWDEARHSMLGEVGFVDLGLDWTRIPINFTWSLNLNTQLTPRERHAVLFFIEQGLMPRTGKRYEWEIGRQSQIPLAALIQDFDWADEVLHAQLGREWYVADFGDLKPAMEYGDRCWSQVLSHWRDYRDKGLTDHHNWWPELYRAACEHWGVAPDPAALGFSETYEDKRADLKGIEVSE